LKSEAKKVKAGEVDDNAPIGRGYNDMLRRKTIAFAQALEDMDQIEAISPDKALKILNV